MLDGLLDGVKLGVDEGFTEGLLEGVFDGVRDGVDVGLTDGFDEGNLLGIIDGEALGLYLVGDADGVATLPVGAGVGLAVGGIMGSKQTGGSSSEPSYVTPSHDTGQASLTVFPLPYPYAGSHHFVNLLSKFWAFLVNQAQSTVFPRPFVNV